MDCLYMLRLHAPRSVRHPVPDVGGWQVPRKVRPDVVISDWTFESPLYLPR